MGNTINRNGRLPGILLAAALSVLCPAGFGEEADPPPSPEKTWRMGVFFWHDSPNDLEALEGIREALAALKRTDELLVEQADEDPKEADRILEKFRAEKVDVIFAMGTTAAKRAMERIKDIPIVFTAVTNPVVSGIVPSWEGSKKNLAGNSNWIPSETVLHVFRLAVPDLERLGILRSAGDSGVVSAAELEAMKNHLAEKGNLKGKGKGKGKEKQETGLKIVEAVADGVKEIPPKVQALAESGVQAIWVPIDKPIYENTDKVLEASEPLGIPVVSSSLKAAMNGAVVGVVVDYKMLGKGALAIAMEILEKDAEPGKIEIGTMKGYRVVANLGAARRCRYRLPLSLLVLADQILEDAEQGKGKAGGQRP